MQKGVINELLEKGFDSLNTLKLVEADDIRSQKIPIGQGKLWLHLAKTLTKGAHPQMDSEPTTVQPVETGSVTQQPEDSMALTNTDRAMGNPTNNHKMEGKLHQLISCLVESLPQLLHPALNPHGRIHRSILPQLWVSQFPVIMTYVTLWQITSKRS